MKLNTIDGIEINNIEMLFYPHQTAFNYNVAIKYSSQQIVIIEPTFVACPHFRAFKFKNEATGLCFDSGPNEIGAMRYCYKSLYIYFTSSL